MARNHALVYLSDDSFYATHEGNEMVNRAVSSILFDPPGMDDIEMIQFVGMGVAMGNAHPDVFPHANYVTKHVDEGGISHALKELNILL